MPNLAYYLLFMGKHKDKSTFAQEYLSGDSTKQIGKRHGVSDETVRKQLHRDGVAMRKVTPIKRFDRHYFNKLDTWEKCYILGFFAADGNIHVTQRSKGLFFTCKDLDVLQFIIDQLHHENPNIYTTTQGVSSLVLSDTNMAELVEGYGFPHCKAKILEYPEWVRNHPYEAAFITGMFDGDGSLAHYSSGGWSLRFYGTESIVRGISDFFTRNNIHLNLSLHQDHLWVARSGSKSVIEKCFETINYLSSPFAMRRKRERVIEFMNSITRHPPQE